MEVIVREYKKSDFTGLIELLANVYGSEIEQDKLENIYLSEKRKILVAVDENNTVAGCAFLEKREDFIRPERVLFISYVAVDEKIRKQGIGKKIFEEIEKIAQKEKCSAIELTSANYRTGAHAFYASLRFSPKKTTVFIKEIG